MIATLLKPMNFILIDTYTTVLMFFNDLVFPKNFIDYLDECFFNKFRSKLIFFPRCLSVTIIHVQWKKRKFRYENLLFFRESILRNRLKYSGLQISCIKQLCMFTAPLLTVNRGRVMVTTQRVGHLNHVSKAYITVHGPNKVSSLAGLPVATKKQLFATELY